LARGEALGRVILACCLQCLTGFPPPGDRPAVDHGVADLIGQETHGKRCACCLVEDERTPVGQGRRGARDDGYEEIKIVEYAVGQYPQVLILAEEKVGMA